MRPNKDEWAIELASVTAKRSTCCRRQVGCILVNSKGHVLATGYNGVAAGQPHCNEMVEVEGDPRVDVVYTHPNACSGALAPSGMNLDGCEAIHAEQNALLQCGDVYQIHTCYVTASPCITCVKLLLNTSCERIVFLDEYPHKEAFAMWNKAGRKWEQLDLTRGP